MALVCRPDCEVPGAVVEKELVDVLVQLLPRVKLGNGDPVPSSEWGGDGGANSSFLVRRWGTGEEEHDVVHAEEIAVRECRGNLPPISSIPWRGSNTKSGRRRRGFRQRSSSRDIRGEADSCLPSERCLRRGRRGGSVCSDALWMRSAWHRCSVLVRSCALLRVCILMRDCALLRSCPWLC